VLEGIIRGVPNQMFATVRHGTIWPGRPFIVENETALPIDGLFDFGPGGNHGSRHRSGRCFMMSLDTDHYMIISSDCHAGADVGAYKPYLASRWHDEFDAWAADYWDPWRDLDPGVTGRLVGASSGGLVTNWDSPQRLSDLEADGITAEVIFPNTSPPFFPSGNLTAPLPLTRDEYDHRWAGLQAHNRWLVDFCGDAPGRRAGIAQIFLNDLDDSLAEIRWIKESGLFGGILLPGVSPGSGLAPLYSPIYEPIWALCEELDIVINTHSGATGRPINVGDGGVAAGAIAAFESQGFANRALFHLIFAGVFERYPRLKLVLTEQGTSWAADKLRSADCFFTLSGRRGAPLRALAGPAVDQMSMKPSEYFARNCWIGASQLLPEEVARRYEIGVDRILWGSDYPHSEGPYPYSREALRLTFEGVASSELRMMLGETAAQVYGFDLDMLRPIADKVGPTVAELALPLERMPVVPDDTVAHIFMPDIVVM
jgi:predicted TIM-barrel fold metal-dependent hydrolase